MVTMKNKIEVNGLNAWYGKSHVLRDINLSIREKSITAILGPSGCGKSTFIRCLNRLHELRHNARLEGEILLDGVSVFSMDPVEVRRKIGMVFQHPTPFPTMSIFDNVAIGLKLNGTKDAEKLYRTVEKSLKIAALWDEVKDKLDAPGNRLSGGQQQRLCIARTIATNPEVIIFDEPTSALDPISAVKIEDLLINLKDKYTVITVTHNIQQARRVSDFIAFFWMGELVEYGPAEEIFENPEKTLTREYLRGRIG